MRILCEWNYRVDFKFGSFDSALFLEIESHCNMYTCPLLFYCGTIWITVFISSSLWDVYLLLLFGHWKFSINIQILFLCVWVEVFISLWKYTKGAFSKLSNKLVLLEPSKWFPREPGSFCIPKAMYQRSDSSTSSLRTWYF